MDWDKIITALASNSIKKLKLNSSNLTLEKIRNLVNLLKDNTSLEQLDLCNNEIDAIAAEAITDVIRYNSHIIKLNLSNNNLGNQGVILISEALEHNRTLQILGLGGNKVGNKGILRLANALKINHTLTELILAYNWGINDRGTLPLIDVLTNRPVLLKLNLRKTKVSNEILAQLDALHEEEKFSIQKPVASSFLEGHPTLAASIKQEKEKKEVSLDRKNKGKLFANKTMSVIKMPDYNELQFPYWRGIKEVSKEIDEVEKSRRTKHQHNFGDLVEFSHDITENKSIDIEVSTTIKDKQVALSAFEKALIGLRENRVSSLSFDGETLDTDMLKKLSHALKQNKSLIRLRFKGGDIGGDQGFALLIHGLKANTNLQHLDLRHTGLTERSEGYLLELIEATPSILELKLKGNHLNKELHRHINVLIAHNKKLKGVDVRVYLESGFDAKFYEGVYCSLKNYFKAPVAKISDIEKEKGNNILKISWQMLSGSYQLTFYDSSYRSIKGQKKEGGINAVIQRMQKVEEHFTDLDDSENALAFGVIDRDYDVNYQELSYQEVDKKIVVLGRHSLENFIFDPFILCSMLTSEEIEKFVNLSNLHDDLEKSKNLVSACLKLKTALAERLFETRAAKKAIQKSLNTYFEIILGALVDYSNKPIEQMRGKAKYLYQKIKGKIATNRFTCMEEMIFIVDGNRQVKVTYPKEFLEIRGHDIEAFFIGRHEGAYNPAYDIVTRVHRDSLPYIPLDLVDTFIELNNKVKIELNPILNLKEAKEIESQKEINSLKPRIKKLLSHYYDNIVERITDAGIIQIKADGDCLFNAILLAGKLVCPSNHIIHKQRNHLALRQFIKPTAHSDALIYRDEIFNELRNKITMAESFVGESLRGLRGALAREIANLRGVYQQSNKLKTKQKLLLRLEQQKDRLFDKYIKMMHQEGAWGGEHEIDILARTLDVKIILLHEGRVFNDQVDIPEIQLCYTGDHYDIILPKQILPNIHEAEDRVFNKSKKLKKSSSLLEEKHHSGSHIAQLSTKSENYLDNLLKEDNLTLSSTFEKKWMNDKQVIKLPLRKVKKQKITGVFLDQRARMVGVDRAVYLESVLDAKFYEGIYFSLKNFSTHKGSNLMNPTLSTSYTLSFYTAKQGEKGGFKAVMQRLSKEIAPDDIINKSDLYKYAYGIIDRDYDVHYDTLIKMNLDKKVVVLPRHSLENFIFDPFIFCSVLEKLKLKKYLNSNKMIYDLKKSKKLISTCVLLKDIIDKKRINKDLGNKKLQANLDVYFKIILGTLADYHDKLNKVPADKVQPLYQAIKDRIAANLPLCDTDMVIICSNNTHIKVAYPKEFLEIRGHDIETFFVDSNEYSNDLSRHIVSRVHRTNLHYIPLDLMDVFSQLTNKINMDPGLLFKVEQPLMLRRKKPTIHHYTKDNERSHKAFGLNLVLDPVVAALNMGVINPTASCMWLTNKYYAPEVKRAEVFVEDNRELYKRGITFSQTQHSRTKRSRIKYSYAIEPEEWDVKPHNYISRINIEELAKNKDSILKLESYGIYNKKFKRIAEVLLERPPTVHTLNISHNFITDRSCSRLSNIIAYNHNLKILDLSYNMINSIGFNDLVVVLREHPSLQEINMRYTHIGNKGAVKFAEILSENNKITHLDLSGNKITTDGANAIANSLFTNSSLQTLIMKRNKVKDAIAMVNMLHANKSLSLVDLRYNNNINVAEINNLIARISDAERIEARIKYKLTGDNDESLSDYKDGDSFLDDNPAGQGTVKLIADDQKLFIPTLFYNKYYKHGLEDILPLRLKAAVVDDTVVLPVIRLSEYTLRFIIKQIAFKLEQGFGNVVIPLNIEDKHWVGLLVRAGANNLEIEYLDSEQNGLSPVFKEQILSYFKGKAVNIVESIFERQKYNNCGPELVENFVKLLGGERVSQEAAPYLHSLLLEQKLIEDAIEEGKPPDPLMVAKALPKKSDITNQEVTHFLKSKEENNIKYTIIDAQGRKISPSLLDEATREQLLYYAKTGILFDSARRAIDEGYGIEIQSSYPIIEPRNEYLAVVSIDNTVSLFLLNEKVWAQLIYFSRTGILFESARQALEDSYNFNPGYGIYTVLLSTSSMRPMVSIEVSTNSINESEEGSIKDEEVELFMEQGNLNDIMQGSSESFYPSIELPNMQQVITALSPFILYYFSYNKALSSPLDIGGMDLFFDFGFL